MAGLVGLAKAVAAVRLTKKNATALKASLVRAPVDSRLN